MSKEIHTVIAKLHDGTVYAVHSFTSASLCKSFKDELEEAVSDEDWDHVTSLDPILADKVVDIRDASPEYFVGTVRLTERG